MHLELWMFPHRMLETRQLKVVEPMVLKYGHWIPGTIRCFGDGKRNGSNEALSAF